MTIVVAGSTGLVGSAIMRDLNRRGESAIGINRNVVDLLDREATFEFIKAAKPQLVIDAAAIVGGIAANNSFPVDFLSKNLQIQSNLMDASHYADVERFVFLGSSCIYPRDSKQPIKEEYLLTGPLEQTNSAYAVAKIAGIELIKSYRKQFNRRWISLMPTNMYGPFDNFNPETSHVLPAFIQKFSKAFANNESTITLWGSGISRREFMHVDDLVSAIRIVADKYDSSMQLNVGTGLDISISELAELMKEMTGFKGNIHWDKSKPDGTPRKVLDVSKIKNLGWEPEISLRDGIASTVEWYKENLTGFVKG